MKDSAIVWCHHTFNLWRGCVHDGVECTECYAEALVARQGLKAWGRRAPRPRTSPGYWQQLPRWNRAAREAGERHRVFVGSLMDWAEGREDQRPILREFWELVRVCTSLDFLMLSKRPQNFASLLPEDWSEWTHGYPNVWLMVSVGDPNAVAADLRMPAIERVPRMLEVPAVVYGVSYEPALAPLASSLWPFLPAGRSVGQRTLPDAEGRRRRLAPPAVDWVIYGAETGPRRRPEGTAEEPKAWAREMRDLCRERGVAFIHKQSSDRFPGRGVELDGAVVEEYPVPRYTERKRKAKGAVLAQFGGTHRPCCSKCGAVLAGSVRLLVTGGCTECGGGAR